MIQSSFCLSCCHNRFKNIEIDEIFRTSLIKAGFCSTQGGSVNYLQTFLMHFHLAHATMGVCLDYYTERGLVGNNELLFCF